jgi:hypothetical protein
MPNQRKRYGPQQAGDKARKKNKRSRLKGPYTTSVHACTLITNVSACRALYGQHVLIKDLRCVVNIAAKLQYEGQAGKQGTKD